MAQSDTLTRSATTAAQLANLLKSDDPIDHALIAEGVVVAVERTGTSVTLDSIELHFCRVTVLVSLPGSQPYVAVCTHKLTACAITRIEMRRIPDATPVIVEVDPAEPRHVRVDWQGSVRDTR